MNNSNPRSFPRYSLEQKKISIRHHNKFIGELMNVSLGGVGIKSNEALGQLNGIQIEMTIGKQVFMLTLNFVWEREILRSNNQKIYHGGFSLEFDDEHQFRPWMLLNQALDKIENKIKS
jgi:hypothetical protein